MSNDDRIKNEQEKIAVETYQESTFYNTWTARGRGMWAVAALGAAFGAVGGAIAPFFPALINETTFTAAAQLIPQSLAIFTAAGMTAGFAVGATVGANSGSAASSAKEMERRERARNIAGALQNDPSLTSNDVNPKITPNPDFAPPAAKPTFWGKIKDTLATYVNFKVGAVIALAGIIGGAILGAAAIALGGDVGLPAATALIGKAPSNAALMAYSMGTMGYFGSLWSFNFPKMATDLQKFVGEVMSGKRLGTQWGPEKNKVVEKIGANTAAEKLATKIIKHSPAMDKIEEAVKTLAPEVVDASNRLQRDAGNIYAGLQPSEPLSQARVENVLSTLHDAYINTGRDKQLQTLENIMQDLNVNPAAQALSNNECHIISFQEMLAKRASEPAINRSGL